VKSFWKRIKRIGVPILLVVFAFLALWGNDMIPWYHGTLDSIYRKQLAGFNATAALLRETSFPDGNLKSTFLLQLDADKAAALQKYLFSLNLQSKVPQSDKGGNLSIWLNLYTFDDSGSVADAPNMSIQIIGAHTLEVMNISNLPNYKKTPYIYSVKDSIDVDKILGFFDGAKDLLS